MEVSATGSIIAKTSAANAFLILLVAELAGFLVAINEVEELRGDRLGIDVRHLFGEVHIELCVLSLIGLVERDNGRAVIVFLNVIDGLIHIDFDAVFVLVFHVTSLVLTGAMSPEHTLHWDSAVLGQAPARRSSSS